jgi:hypothetical protein
MPLGRGRSRPGGHRGWRWRQPDVHVEPTMPVAPIGAGGGTRIRPRLAVPQGLGSAGHLGLWLRLVETAEEQLHLVSFAVPPGESGAGNERIASCTDLRGHRPADESADRCPKGGYPHGNLRLLGGPALHTRRAWRHPRGRGRRDGPISGRQPGHVGAPTHRVSGCVSADVAYRARDVGRGWLVGIGTARRGWAPFCKELLRNCKSQACTL